MPSKSNILEAINAAINAGFYTPTHYSGFAPEDENYPYSIGDLLADDVDAGFSGVEENHVMTFLVTIYTQRSDGGAINDYIDELRAILDNQTLSNVTGWRGVGLVIDSTTNIVTVGPEEIAATVTYNVFATEG